MRAPSPQLEREILRILHANPPLMKDYIEQRQRALQHVRDRRWEKSLRADERKHLTGVIANRLAAITVAFRGRAMIVEREAFRGAKSRDEYYRLIAERTRQVESELEDQQLCTEE